jgi:hypothetical protein
MDETKVTGEPKKKKRRIMHSSSGIITVSDKAKPTINDDHSIYMREQNK